MALYVPGFNMVKVFKGEQMEVKFSQQIYWAAKKSSGILGLLYMHLIKKLFYNFFSLITILSELSVKLIVNILYHFSEI